MTDADIDFCGICGMKGTVARRESEEQTVTDMEKLAKAIELLRPLARPARWFWDNERDDIYLGTQLQGIASDVTPTVGECRAAARFLSEIAGEL